MMHRPFRSSGLFLASAALSLASAQHSYAQQAAPQPPQPPEPTKAEPAKPAKTESQIKAGELFSEGRKLVEAGSYKEACPKFEQSASLNLGIGVQFNLADCWEHIGRT